MARDGRYPKNAGAIRRVWPRMDTLVLDKSENAGAIFKIWPRVDTLVLDKSENAGAIRRDGLYPMQHKAACEPATLGVA